MSVVRIIQNDTTEVVAVPNPATPANVVTQAPAQPAKVVRAYGAKGDKGDKGDTGDQGPQGIQGPKGDTGDSTIGAYRHIQGIAAAVWTVSHGLGFYPNVTVVDSTGREVIGDTQYIDINTIQLTFNGGFSGEAYVS